MVSALEMVRDSPPHRSLSALLGRLLGPLRDGATFAEALTVLGSWLPRFDHALLGAGEQSGRLDVCFRFLAEYYEERARLARQILSDLTYPVFVLHFAVLIFPTTMLTRLVVQGDVIGFLMAKGMVLLPLYAGVVLLAGAGKPGRSERWRSGVEIGLRHVPVLGAARANLSLARLSLALESLLNAGVTIIEAWELAAAASGSPSLRRTVALWKPNVLDGQTPADAVRESRAFPTLFTNLYSTGEVSGQLDQTLHRLYQHYQDEGTRQLRAVAQWVPRLIYLAIVLVIAYQVVSFWSGYFSQIANLSQ